MKVSIARFFRFCANHESLVRAMTHVGDEETTEEAVRAIIQRHVNVKEESVETVYRSMVELQILVPLKTERNTMLVAQQLVSLVRYLVDEARPATPQMIQGYIDSLSAVALRLNSVIESGDTSMLPLMLDETRNILSRIIRDVEETQDTIVREVMAFKVGAAEVSAKTKFAQIIYWLRYYAEPMVELVRVDGPMDATFAELERVLRDAHAKTWAQGVEQSLNLLRTVTRHSWHVCDQCLKELRPLYDSWRQTNLIASGAAYALEKLKEDRMKGWNERFVVGVATFRHQNLLSDEGIVVALNRNFAYTPRQKPVISDEDDGDESPISMESYEWLNSLTQKVATNLPVNDLCKFLLADKPAATADEIVCGIAKIYFDPAFASDFGEKERSDYPTSDNPISASPIEVTTHV